MMGALAVSASSCSDDDWTPGPDAPDNDCVYFTSLLPGTLQTAVDEITPLKLIVKRNSYDNAVSVPLIVESNVDGFLVPATADFAAGEKSVELIVDYSGVPLKTDCTLNIAIDPTYANTYGAGASSTSMTVQVSDWVVFAESVHYSFNKDFSEYDGGALMNLEGTSKFLFKDFMKSGLDLKVTTGMPWEAYPGWYEFLPLNNYLWYSYVFGEEETQRCWFLFDDATYEYPTFSPDGGSIEIEYMWCYNYYYTPGSYTDPDSYIGPNKGYAQINFWADYTDGSGNWNYVFMDFSPLYDYENPGAVEGGDDESAE